MNLDIVILIALGIVVGILIAGLFTLFRQGTEARNMSQQLMRYRVIAQAAAVLIIMALLYFTSR